MFIWHLLLELHQVPLQVLKSAIQLFLDLVRCGLQLDMVSYEMHISQCASVSERVCVCRFFAVTMWVRSSAMPFETNVLIPIQLLELVTSFYHLLGSNYEDSCTNGSNNQYCCPFDLRRYTVSG